MLELKGAEPLFIISRSHCASASNAVFAMAVGLPENHKLHCIEGNFSDGFGCFFIINRITSILYDNNCAFSVIVYCFISRYTERTR